MPPAVHTLLCHQDVETGLRCLRSLKESSTEKLSFVVHDDGTLTDQDRQSLKRDLEPVRIIARTEADAVVDEKLRRYPHCAAFRKQHVLALKLFDVPILAEQEDIAYVDSDVFFASRTIRLFSWPAASVGMIFMQDSSTAYSIYPLRFLFSPIKLNRRINTGMFLVRRAAYDLDFLEHASGRCELDHILQWKEQTLWSALSVRTETHVWDPSEIGVFDPKQAVPRTAAHFTKSVRGALPGYPQRPSNEAVAVRTVPATRCSSFVYVLDRSRIMRR